MKKIQRTALSMLLTLCLAFSAIGPLNVFSVGAQEATISTATAFRNLTAEEMLNEMGAGWNLGNTMDANADQAPNESAWGAPTTTKAMIKGVHDYGFNTLRIPTTWGKMIQDDQNYEINPLWIQRVQEIADYAISLDMYVMINMHHDGAENGGWLDTAHTGDKWDADVARFQGAWTSIANAFKDYDEHLILAGMNEVRARDPQGKGHAKINQLNQVFVNAVRATGGNNTQRWLIVPSAYSSPNDWVNKNQVLPTDDGCTAGTNRLMIEYHYYGNDWRPTGYPQLVKNIRESIDELAAERGITETVPMVCGEYGFVSGTTNDFGAANNAYGFELLGKASKTYNCVPVLWDTPGNAPNTMFNRELNKPDDLSIASWKAMARSAYRPVTAANLEGDFSDVVNSEVAIPATEIALGANNLTIAMGTRQKVTATALPDNNNDVIIWTSADENIATVFNGLVHAKNVGKTTLTAYSQEGKATATMTVNVTADYAAPAVSGLTVNEYAEQTDEEGTVTGTYIPVVVKDTLQITLGGTADGKVALAYSSSDESIFYVNTVGKIYGRAEGVAYLTVTAASGATFTCEVRVESAGAVESLDVVLCLQYTADKGNMVELGQVVSITGNGQYTVTYDIATDQSDASKGKGITNINSLTSLYIKDAKVQAGAAANSPMESCEIRYDSIVIGNPDGETHDVALRTPAELLAAPKGYISDNRQQPTYFNRDNASYNIQEDGFMNCIKEGTFDTNGPMNGWDGCVAALSEFKIDNRSNWNPAVSFTHFNNTTKVSITFTLRNVEFSAPEESEGNPATDIARDTDRNVELAEGATAEFGVQVTPNDTDSTVYFVSSDASVAYVDTLYCATINEQGLAYVNVVAGKAGTATITAYTNNGLTSTFNVTVKATVVKDDLQAKYDAVKETAGDDYTVESYAAFTAKLEAALAVLENEEATQAEVDAALADLTAAYDALETKPEEPTPGTPDDPTPGTSEEPTPGTSDDSNDDIVSCSSSIGASNILLAGLALAVCFICKKKEN